jgi:hypothetical protein
MDDRTIIRRLRVIYQAYSSLRGQVPVLSHRVQSLSSPPLKKKAEDNLRTLRRKVHLRHLALVQFLGQVTPRCPVPFAAAAAKALLTSHRRNRRSRGLTSA